MTVVGRSKIDHPALGTAGGSALHAAIETIYTNIGDDLAGRFDTASSIANSTVTTFDHNFGVDFADLKVLLYTGSHPNLTRVPDPAGSGWTIAATVGFLKTKIDVTTPSSGGPHTFAVFVTQGRETDASATSPGIVSISAQTFAGKKTFQDGLAISGGSAANNSMWLASNVLHLRGGTSGFSLDNTSGIAILEATDAGVFTVGPSGDTDVNLKVNGSMAVGATASNNFTSGNSIEAGQASLYGDSNASYLSHNVYYASGWKSSSNSHHNQIHFDSSGNTNFNYAAASASGSPITWITIGYADLNGNWVFGPQQSLNYNGPKITINGAAIVAGTPSTPTSDQSGALEINANTYRGAAGNRYETTLTGAGMSFLPRTADGLDCISFYVNKDGNGLTAAVTGIAAATALGNWSFGASTQVAGTYHTFQGTNGINLDLITSGEAVIGANCYYDSVRSVNRPLTARNGAMIAFDANTVSTNSAISFYINQPGDGPTTQADLAGYITGDTNWIFGASTGDLPHYFNGIHTANATYSGSGNIRSGDYVPTITNGTNVSSSTAYKTLYIQLGKMTYVFGVADITVTTGAYTASAFDISLPIASNLAGSTDLSGVLSVTAAASSAFSSGVIYGNPTNDRATVNFNASVSGAGSAYFCFSYERI